MQKQIAKSAALVGISAGILAGSQANSAPRYGYAGQERLKAIIQPVMKHIAERAYGVLSKIPRPVILDGLRAIRTSWLCMTLSGQTMMDMKLRCTMTLPA